LNGRGDYYFLLEASFRYNLEKIFGDFWIWLMPFGGGNANFLEGLYRDKNGGNGENLDKNRLYYLKYKAR